MPFLYNFSSVLTRHMECALYFLQHKELGDNGVTDRATQDKPGNARNWDENTWGRASPLSTKKTGEVFAQGCCSVAEAR